MIKTEMSPELREMFEKLYDCKILSYKMEQIGDKISVDIKLTPKQGLVRFENKITIEKSGP